MEHDIYPLLRESLMIYGILGMAIILLIIIYMHIETRMVEVRHISFTGGLSSLKILHMSDIHIHRMNVDFKKIRKIIHREKPDLILMTGDYIDHRSHIPRFYSFLHAINPGIPTFVCLGNHDYEVFLQDPEGFDDYIRKIQSFGCHVLLNEGIHFEKNQKIYHIIGIEDIKYHRQNIGKALSGVSNQAFLNIAISHNPDIVFQLPEGKVDYLFCGHFHGGQIWAPFNIEFKLMRREKLCKMGIKRGLHKVNGIHLYINRGMGCVCFPFRFFSRPEITVYRLPSE